MVAAIFDFSSVLMILLLMICSCTYLRDMQIIVTWDPPYSMEARNEIHRNRSTKTGMVRNVVWESVTTLLLADALNSVLSPNCRIHGVHVETQSNWGTNVAIRRGWVFLHGFLRSFEVSSTKWSPTKLLNIGLKREHFRINTVYMFCWHPIMKTTQRVV